MSALTNAILLFVIFGTCMCEYDEYEGPVKCSCNKNANERSRSLLSQTLGAIQCCSGETVCKKESNMTRNISPRSHLLCFSETSCIHDSYERDITCHKNVSECFLNPLSLYNVSNIFKRWSMYKCIDVLNVNNSICLLPLCNSFGAVERACSCDQFSCTCYTFSETSTLKPPVSLETFAVFLSFAETYVTVNQSRFSTVNVLIILFSVLGLMGAIIVFLKCITFLRTNRSPTQNVNTVSNRFLASFRCRRQPSGQRPKESNTVAQNSPRPNLPTYKEAVQNEKIFVIEPPPKYSDTTPS